MSDLIDRQAAIDYVDDVPYIKMHPNIGLLWKAWIEQLPSAQRTGKWIITGTKNIYGGTLIECSECHDRVMVQHIADEMYCRHCGARMDEE